MAGYLFIGKVFGWFLLFLKLLSLEEKNKKVLCYIMAKVGNWPDFLFLLVRTAGCDLLMYQIDG